LYWHFENNIFATKNVNMHVLSISTERIPSNAHPDLDGQDIPRLEQCIRAPASPFVIVSTITKATFNNTRSFRDLKDEIRDPLRARLNNVLSTTEALCVKGVC
jgi:hypothetical protein